MIEGLLQTPWINLQARRDRRAVELLRDCNRCKQTNSREVRQTMACPYEAPIEGAEPAGVHPGFLEEHGAKAMPSTCAGYTTKLPAVEERTWHLHWLKLGGGAMLEAALGSPPTERDLRELRLLEAETERVAAWEARNPVRKEPGA